MVAPYSGLKVLDLSQGIAGPYCAMILLESGAEVIKVEPPTGDWGRNIGIQVDGMNSLSIAYNLGKRSICIDASKEHGRALMHQLALQADVVIESFRPGVTKRLGLSYDELSKKRPDLVYVSVTAFGADGPYAMRPGSDSTLQAMSGMMVVNKDANQNPRKVGILLVDITTGIYAAQAVGAALYNRAINGKGARVEVSLLDAAAAIQSGAIVDEALSEGNVSQPLSVPAGTFATQDGHINVTSLHDRMFIGLCHAIEKNEWIADKRFSTAAHRFSYADEINSALKHIFYSKTTAYWIETLNKHGVVCGKVSGYSDFLEDPHVAHRQIFKQSGMNGPHNVRVARVPGTPRENTGKRAPRQGEDTREILSQFGFSEKQQQELFDSGAVSAWQDTSK
ncbi:CoA transferase [Pollutimonas nitritireducens]|uniref:CoA transferase n=1 Tax=Pollutimonas nitritireducens TaxID=2045209 RepID=A0A2N4ULR4_9BURK|nr:CoA transferase [Pollutimonas nitritireducens]